MFLVGMTTSAACISVSDSVCRTAQAAEPAGRADAAERIEIDPYQPVNIAQHDLTVGDRAFAIGYAANEKYPTGRGPDPLLSKRNETPEPG
jgi:hypothetical protein